MDEKKLQTNNRDIKVLRTYTSDMAEAIRENEASVIKIALAEKAKREEEEVYKKADGSKTSKIFFVIGGIFLIIIAIIGSSILISKKEKTPPVVINNTETFINYDSFIIIDVTNINNSDDLLNKIEQSQEINSGSVRVLSLVKKVGEVTQTLKTNDFFSIFKINIPGSLLRSFSDKYLIGEHLTKNDLTQKEEPSIFFIFETNNYNQTYASLLEWEKSIRKDLSIFLNPKNQTYDDFVTQKPWQDIVVNNKDVRILYGQTSGSIVCYVFVDNKLIIAKNIETLKEIITRLSLKTK